MGLPQGFQAYSAQVKSYTDLVQPGGGWDAQSIPYNQAPAVVSGFVLVLDTVSSPSAYSSVPASDGTFLLNTAGDTSRQSLNGDIYNFLLRAYYGGALFFVNNQTPVFTAASVVLTLAKNIAISPIPLAPYWADAEDDALTISAVDALPGSLSVSGNSLTGTSANANRIDTITFRGTDIAGDFDDGDIVIITGQVQVPDVETHFQSDAQDALANAYLVAVVALDYSKTVAAGYVISQDIPAGSYIDPKSSVLITVSLGPAIRFRPSIAPRRTRRRPYL